MFNTAFPKRLGVISVAILAALLVWGIARLIGVEPVVDSGDGTRMVGPADIVVATLIGGLAAWGVHALMVRRCETARWWPFVGSTALAISMIGPSRFSDGSSAMALMCIHFAVGAVLIAGFALLDSFPFYKQSKSTPSQSHR